MGVIRATTMRNGICRNGYSKDGDSCCLGMVRFLSNVED